jgi:hypothetical protein
VILLALCFLMLRNLFMDTKNAKSGCFIFPWTTWTCQDALICPFFCESSPLFPANGEQEDKTDSIWGLAPVGGERI